MKGMGGLLVILVILFLLSKRAGAADGVVRLSNLELDITDHPAGAGLKQVSISCTAMNHSNAYQEREYTLIVDDQPTFATKMVGLEPGQSTIVGPFLFATTPRGMRRKVAIDGLSREFTL